MAQKGRSLGVVNFEELRRGGIGLFFVTVNCRIASMGKRFSGVRTQDIAYARCMGELAYYRLLEAKGVFRQVRNRTELDAHLADWEDDPADDPAGVSSSAWKARTASWDPNRCPNGGMRVCGS